MTNGSEQFAEIREILKDVAARQQEMAVRQQYHDEAFGRHDVTMRRIEAAQERDGERIHRLVRISELLHERLERLEGGEPS